MKLWRISNFADLSGEGGRRYSARWHSKGRPVVYLATSPASALLETIVHLELDSIQDLPESYQLLEVNIPKSISRKTAVVPVSWNENVLITQELGDDWLRGKGSALLKVPSALVPMTDNFLLNPMHPDAANIVIVSAQTYPFEDRLSSLWVRE